MHVLPLDTRYCLCPLLRLPSPSFFFFFFFNDTATTEIYTLSLHDALPIWVGPAGRQGDQDRPGAKGPGRPGPFAPGRSEEHTSELQSRVDLVCRLLLEKKKKKKKKKNNT